MLWSSLFNNQEILLAINTDTDNDNERTAWVTIDSSLHTGSGVLTCLYSTDPGQVGAMINIESRNGKVLMLGAPAAGFVI